MNGWMDGWVDGRIDTRTLVLTARLVRKESMSASVKVSICKIARCCVKWERSLGYRTLEIPHCFSRSVQPLTRRAIKAKPHHLHCAELAFEIPYEYRASCSRAWRSSKEGVRAESSRSHSGRSHTAFRGGSRETGHEATPRIGRRNGRRQGWGRQDTYHGGWGGRVGWSVTFILH